MYPIGAVVLLGLGVAAVVAVVGSVIEIPRAVRLFLALLAGFGITWAADYSMFEAWEIVFRRAWMGPVGTGLVIGGLAAAWDEVIRLTSSFVRHVEDQSKEIESRFPRAA